MTQSITQIFSNKGNGSGMRGSDDGGYAKPGASDNFGSSHNAEFGGDFSKLDFDKPLFDYKASTKDSPDNHDGQDHSQGAGAGGSYGSSRSLYSSSTQNKNPNADRHSSQKLGSIETSG